MTTLSEQEQQDIRNIDIIPEERSYGLFVMRERQIPHGRSLKYYLTVKSPGGLPEDSIATVLRAVLKGVDRIHSLYGEEGEPVVKSDRIYFLWELWEMNFEVKYGIRVAYHPQYMHKTGEGDDTDDKPTELGVWGVGILALELAYGTLPPNLGRQELFTMAKNLIRIVNAHGNGNGSSMKKLPVRLEMLLDEEYVKREEEGKQTNGRARGIGIQEWAKRVLEDCIKFLLLKREAEEAQEEEEEEEEEEREEKLVSGDFLQVVMTCLDKDQPTPPIDQILQLPFFPVTHPLIDEQPSTSSGSTANQ